MNPLFFDLLSFYYNFITEEGNRLCLFCALFLVILNVISLNSFSMMIVACQWFDVLYDLVILHHTRMCVICIFFPKLIDTITFLFLKKSHQISKTLHMKKALEWWDAYCRSDWFGLFCSQPRVFLKSLISRVDSVRVLFCFNLSNCSLEWWDAPHVVIILQNSHIF